MFLLLALCLSAARADNWMQRLPDDTFVAVLSIPGTHDSATGCGWAAGYEATGNEYALTQELNFAQQWSVGVRAFDLRPALYDGFMCLHHGVMPTVARFEDVLAQLCDSLKANPSEFVVIHLRHESDGDQTDDDYNQRIQQVLSDEALQPYLVDFRKELTVADMRGKMLILSREQYADKPLTGGFFLNWSHSAAWADQLKGQIKGKNVTAGLTQQDFYDTHASGDLEKKVTAVERVLKWTMEHKTSSKSYIRWVVNFVSGYSKVLEFFGFSISLSDGYRDNAAAVHAAVLKMLQEHAAGPTGIIFMDYAGVDQSNGYEVRGQELVQAIINNNFQYLLPADAITSSSVAPSLRSATIYDLSGTRVEFPSSLTTFPVSPRSRLLIVDGRKVLLR
ncbi:MAG: hypothetical protein K6C30_08925 [Bacteroidaceae bacterium]|nr:hypothetical protein [Bacteroidaceae bacterium]